MITLYTLPPGEGFPSLSPFCGKLDVWLQLSGLPFERRTADPRKAPNGKVPYVSIDGGAPMGDSAAIIRHLAERVPDLDAHLTPQQRAQVHVMRRMVEEAMYFVLLHARWVTDAGYRFVYDALLAKAIPAPIRVFAAPMIRRGVRKQTYAQGTGRHPIERIYQMGRDDLDALALMIGDGPFGMGERPCSLDATLYAFLSMVVHCPYPDPVTDHARTLTPITAYCDRMVALLADRAAQDGPASS